SGRRVQMKHEQFISTLDTDVRKWLPNIRKHLTEIDADAGLTKDDKLLVKAFEEEGFNFDRQRGDHLIYTKPGVSRPLVIPMYDAVPAVFIIKNLLRMAGMSRERFLELLQNI